MTRWQLLGTALTFEGLLVVAALAGNLWLDLGLFEMLTIDASAVGYGAVATLPMLLLLWWTSRSRWKPLRVLRFATRRVLHDMFANARPIDIVVIAALAGIGEELFFRGVLIDGLSSIWPVWMAVVVASLVFGAAHAITPAYMWITILVGFYLSGVYLKFGLIAAVVAHGLYDLIALSVLVNEIRRWNRPGDEIRLSS